MYIPLGGNRVSRTRHIINLFVVWALTGLWHGANWTFVVWGLMYFVLLVFEKYTHLDKIFGKKMHILPHIYTLLLVMFGWILFRSDNIANAATFIKSMFGPWVLQGDNILIREYIAEYILIFALSFFFLVPGIQNFFHGNNKYKVILRDILLLLILLLSVAYIMKGSYSPFIYFNF